MTTAAPPTVDRPAAGVTSEVGRLRTVLLHHPGEELRRLTPRNSADLLFDGIPWVERAQTEHDAFAAALRGHGVEVLVLRDLLVDVLGIDAERQACVDAAVSPGQVGPWLAARLRADLLDRSPQDLATALIAGVTVAELADGGGSLLARIGHPGDFVVPPLPNLLFTRDSSVVIGTHVAVTRPAMAARRREVALTAAIWRSHPRLAATPRIDTAAATGLEGGDVLVLGRGVLAVGIGQRTTPAAVEILAAQAFSTGQMHTVLAVPIAQERATMHLDTVCTMVDTDAVVMYPLVAEQLRAWTITPAGTSGPLPFLQAAAQALELERIRVIDTGLDPVTAEREQWDDGNNTLAIGPGLVVAYERNTRTNGRLTDAGIEVVAIAGSELGSGRGGPRCMSCPVARDPTG